MSWKTLLVACVAISAIWSCADPAAPTPAMAERAPATTIMVPATTIMVMPPNANHDSNHAWQMALCSRGDRRACLLVGAWLSARKGEGRELELCLHARAGDDDRSSCVELDATWPALEQQ